MKYTIEGFSQKKLFDYGLDFFDALILRWFMSFSSTGRMKKCVKENEVYYWVQYQAVIDEFPCAYVNNVKSVIRRFEKYVEIGLLKKWKIYSRNSGSKTLFSITKLALSLEYEDSVVESESKDKLEQTKLSTLKNDNKKLERTKMSTLNELERTKMSTHLNNPETILNPNINSNSSTTKNEILPAEKTAEEKVKQKLEELFGSHKIFSSDLSSKIAEICSKNNICSEIDYVTFCFELSKNHKPKDLANFFYKTILQDFTVQKFIAAENLKQSEKEKLEQRMIICPACGKKFLPDYKTECPECEFAIKDFDDQEKLLIQKKYLLLPAEQKQNYQKRISEIFFCDMTKFIRMSKQQKEELKQKQNFEKLELDKTFGLVS